MWWVIAFLATFILSFPFIWWYGYLYKFRALNKIPGPTPLPVIGNATDIGKTPIELLENMTKFCETYGVPFKFFIGPIVKVAFATPELLMPVLTSNTEIVKSDGYDLLKPWLGDGLLVSIAAKWKRRRKLITPTFHFQILEDFVKVFASKSGTLIQRLQETVGQESVDIKPFINVYSLDIICATAMGIDVRSQENQNLEYVNAVREFLNIMIVRFFSAWERFPAIFRFSPKYKNYKRSLTILHDFSRKVIEARKTRPETENAREDIKQEAARKKTALLDMLLNQRKINNLTDEDIREEIDTFIFEGHDTVTAGISFALYSLAAHPKVQQKVYEEIQAVVESPQDEITIYELQNLTYLDMVIKEAQRKYPSVPMFERRLTNDMTIDGQLYPAGTTISMFIYAMHRSEKLYPHPDKFDPERFLPENVQKRHPFAYVPFSAGPRNCIGQKFAVLEMKTALVKILQRFELLSVPGFEPVLGMSAILQSYNGLLVKLKERRGV